MGMPSAFDPDQADFSNITKEEQIYIDAALHKAFIAVNEEGTEAAAATAILLAGKGMPANEPIEINLNSPFFFILQDRETGTILFYGRVMNPLQN
jgi:serpin B